MRSDNLKRHLASHSCKAAKPLSDVKEIPRYGSVKDIPGYESLKNVDTASEVSFGTSNRIINVDHSQYVEGVGKMLKRKPVEDVISSPPPKRAKDDRPDIIDCVGYITRLNDKSDDDGSIESI